jgi:hypothetical protein
MATEPSQRFAWLQQKVFADAAREVPRLDWSQTRAKDALLCLPAIILIWAVALWRGHLSAGVLTSVGAVSVGFGAFQRMTRFAWAPMVLAAFGMASATWLGSVLGAHTVTATLAVGVAGLLLGLITPLGTGAWWTALQWTIGLIVCGAYSVGIDQSYERAGLVLLGGSLQALTIILIWWWRGKPFDVPEKILSDDRTGELNLSPPEVWRVLSIRDPRGHYAWRVAIILAAGALISRLSGLQNGYWIPMTAAVCMKPDFQTTFTRSLARLFGTLVGAALTTLFTAWCRPDPAVLAICVVISVWLCYTLARVNYAIFSITITAYVVFLLSIRGLPGPAVAAHRALGTLIGGALALGAHALLVGTPVVPENPQADA